MKTHTHNQGFSIIELLVASALFITVVSVAAGSFISTLDASKRARELQELSANLDFVLEDMSRNIRTGEDFSSSSCDGSSCAFRTYTDNDSHNVGYELDDGQILKTGGPSSLSNVALTTSNITVTELDFEVDDSGSDEQPRVIINLVAETEGSVQETFYLQTSVTQRILDN